MEKNYLVVFTSMLDRELFVDSNGNFYESDDNCFIEDKDFALSLAYKIFDTLNDLERVHVYEYIYKDDGDILEERIF